MVLPLNIQSDILALDFDGVIADSIKECLVSGHNAYCTYRQKGDHVEHFEALDPEWATKARKMRNFIRFGEDFVYIAHALANGVEIDNQSDFDAFLVEHQNLRQLFFNHITNQRISFSTAKPDQWGQLNSLYDGMSDLLTYFPKKENLYIITTKKLLFVHKILKTYEIELIKDNIRDTSNGLTKRMIIEDILKDRAVEPDRFYFIDDQVDTLINVKPTGVHVLMAGWGYNNPRQQALAREQDIPVLSLDMLQRIIQK